MQADWTAVYVETPRLQRLPAAERDRILRNLRLAEQLGATSITLGGGDAGEELLAYARASNATRVVVGRQRRGGVSGWFRLSAADRIIAAASDLEVVVVGADVEDTAAPARALSARSREHLGVPGSAASDAGWDTCRRPWASASRPPSRCSWPRSSRR
jgi:two-component system sensor histidine kinase KdpD